MFEYTTKRLIDGYKIAGVQLGGGLFIAVPQKLIKRQRTVKVSCGSQSMTVNRDSVLVHEETFKDKFGRGEYTLNYYEWKPEVQAVPERSVNLCLF